MKLDKNSRQFLQRFDKNIKGKFSYLPSLIESMTVKSINDMLVIDSDLPCDMFNILCCNAAPSNSSVLEAIGHFRSKKLPYAFWIGFENEPLEIEENLQGLGLITEEMEWAMFCDLSQNYPKVETNYFEIEKVSSHERALDIVKVMNSIFSEHEHQSISTFFIKASPFLIKNDSNLVFFIAYENKEPIGVSSLYFGEGLASIFDVIVVPQKRGQGLGKLMTQYAMLEAKNRGINCCILTATNDAKHLYRKLGFEDIKTMKVYNEPT